ncbi:MAG: hypothetical protein E7370_05315 [Clostridiales bacterium]|nr:hypothetical protein [Clostridiales bacterium]
MTKNIKILLLALFAALPILTVFYGCDEHKHANFTNEQIIVSPTCTTDGSGTHVCGDCDETVEFIIPKLGHTEVIDQGIAPSCTADGISEGKHCSVCNEILLAQQTLPAAHTPSEWQILKKASCEVDGYKIRTCLVCEERVATEVLTKLGHFESDWEITKAPTCLIDGTKCTTCLNCDEVMQTASVPATGHDESDWTVTKEPTCTNTGSKNTICLTCNDVIQTATIEATGHNESDWITTLEAKCESSGSKHIVCLTCKTELETETIAALGHNKTDWVTTKAPTCTDMGIKHIECTRCDKTFDETTVDALGHTYSDTTVSPTCTNDGYTKHDCIRCNHSYNSDVVEKTGHEYSTKLTEPTCVDSGHTTYTCIKCNDSYNDNFTSALGHEYNEITENPTCKTGGKKYNKCARCENEVLIETYEATGHNFIVNTYDKNMGNSTTRTATIHECANGGCDITYVSKIVFSYSISPDDRINANTGYSYGMSVNYSDLNTKNTVENFRVDTSFTFEQHNSIFSSVNAHYYITSSGSVDKELGFVSGVDEKVDAIANSIGYIEADDDSEPWSGYVNFPYNKLEDNHVYFVFINENYTAAYTVKTVSCTATFDFGDPPSDL